MRSAIFVTWSSTLLFCSTARAQEKPWELSLGLGAYNTNYAETYTIPNDGNPGALNGNSFTVLALRPSITYRGRQQLSLPFFVTIEAVLPIVTATGLEVGHDTVSSQSVFVTQKEDVRHVDVTGRAVLGYEILPFLQPYMAYERSSYAARRTGEMDGNDAGNFSIGDNQDYTETVSSTQLGFGVQGVVPLNRNADIRLRYDFGYEVPQSVSVTNDYYGTGSFGEGASGYTIAGKVQLDMPLHIMDLFENHDGYWTIGLNISKRHWNGDGALGHGIQSGLPATLTWPANTVVKAGGFVGVGLFF